MSLYENPAQYNESLGKDEWDVGLAARDLSTAEYLAFRAKSDRNESGGTPFGREF